jgi:cobalt-zinc-cadmium efflux system protein
MSEIHAHNHTHSHAHLHGAQDATPRRLAIALALTLGFVVLEAVAGWQANSLALLTDAAHNFSDALALGLSWWAINLSLRPSNNLRTYGYHRAGILAAFVNAATLGALALGIAYEAVQRLMTNPEVHEDPIIMVAAVGFVINAGIALGLMRASRNDVNVRSTFIHFAGDALSTIGVVLAGIGIKLTGWHWFDPAISVLIGVLIIWSAWGIVRETVEILLEGTPRDVDMSALVRDMMSVPGVRGVHDLHVWSISSSLRALSAHILTDNMTLDQGAQVQQAINQRLVSRYDIGHATLQLECVGCAPDVLYCELEPGH